MAMWTLKTLMCLSCCWLGAPCQAHKHPYHVHILGILDKHSLSVFFKHFTLFTELLYSKHPHRHRLTQPSQSPAVSLGSEHLVSHLTCFCINSTHAIASRGTEDATLGKTCSHTSPVLLCSNPHLKTYKPNSNMAMCLMPYTLQAVNVSSKCPIV